MPQQVSARLVKSETWNETNTAFLCVLFLGSNAAGFASDYIAPLCLSKLFSNKVFSSVFQFKSNLNFECSI